MSRQEFLTVRQACDRTGAEVACVRYAIKKKQIKWTRLAGTYLIPIAELSRITKLAVAFKQRRIMRTVTNRVLNSAEYYGRRHIKQRRKA